ncbi:MAG: GNAT family N-acetyltransferase, partial [Microcoleaceae cyanobacterium]
MSWIFLPLDGSVNRDNFDCGNSDLNEYLKKYARQSHRKGIATTFIAIPETENRNVVGYYSVSMAEIKRESLPETYRQGLPRYPLPAMRVGKLAVDKTMQGRGLGKVLLMECFKKAVRLSSEVGIFAIAVDAFDEEA